MKNMNASNMGGAFYIENFNFTITNSTFGKIYLHQLLDNNRVTLDGSKGGAFYLFCDFKSNISIELIFRSSATEKMRV